ncbi:MAG TPA: N-6 DNA methylase [Aggregatilinea sp.]|uniref:HsdM family class I SAM-dependent methyltransferase n=1 Tax=Aggregatilinea sp. TaxID=2806333 RepID=UPI002C6DE627|nr:N-6 DNA methylase [Aggregatilinea sp.]HML22080.1 N-6 DNA methylase [Aggregatilinea sp.]
MPSKEHLAAYYTPLELAQILTNWAITNATDTVLDPSFGGCSFLYSALNSLQKVGAHNPGKQIYGVDIAEDSSNYLEPLIASGASMSQFIKGDFFSITPKNLIDTPFAVVVGNPPYIRYHDIPKDLQHRAISRLAEVGLEISGRASYWAFFLLYSMQFLREGGRLAMILPGALLHTDYSEHVRSLLVRFFRTTTIVLLNERVFDGTDEESVLVLASGAREKHESVQVVSAKNLEVLRVIVESIDSHTPRPSDDLVGDGQWLRALVDKGILDDYEDLIQQRKLVRLGEYVSPRIGVVTGNNNFFILSPDDQKRLSIPDNYLIPIVPRATYLKGLSVTKKRLLKNFASNTKHLLLSIKAGDELPESVLEYLQIGEQTGISDARKCKDRRIWYVVPYTFAPSAFLPIMVASWPRIVVNRSGYTCTNNILRLEWRKAPLDIDWYTLAVGTLSSVSQLSSELVGRSYGGGVLKLEPREFSQLVIPVLPSDLIKDLKVKINTLLWEDRLREATEAVDTVLIDAGILSPDMVQAFRRARNILFLRRRHHRNDIFKILGDEWEST